jgi:hypothetical protein
MVDLVQLVNNMQYVKKEVRTINGVKKLRCSQCKYWYPFEEYSNNKYTSTGKMSYCKHCQKSHYDDKRNVVSNTSIVGVFVYACECCKEEFVTKKSNKVYCSNKCRKHDWYVKNEKGNK